MSCAKKRDWNSSATDETTAALLLPDDDDDGGGGRTSRYPADVSSKSRGKE